MSNSIIFEQHDDDDAIVEITVKTKQEKAQVARFLKSCFTYKNDGARYSWAFEQGFHDGNEYFYNAKSSTIPIGLIPKAVRFLKEQYKHLKIGVTENIRKIYARAGGEYNEEKVRQFCTDLKLYNTEKKVEITPYDHQISLCLRGINGRRISLMACTASGKSLSIYSISRYLMEVEKKRVLIITPSSGLVIQLFNDFHVDYGWKEANEHCTMIHGASKDRRIKDIVISTWQSLQRKLPEMCPTCKKIRIKKNRPKECPECKSIVEESKKFFTQFEAIIVDEAHSTRGAVLRDILSNCVNANNFKIGMSGTLPEDGMDSGLIEGALGRREVVVRYYELIEKGILPPVEIHSIKIPYVTKDRRYICRQNYDNEYYLLTNNGSRKKVMELLINGNKITPEQNTLILYKRKETLEDMLEYLQTNFPQFTYHVIVGEVSGKKREAIRNEIRQKPGNIVIATYGTMKQGVNIELLHNVVFAEYSKSMYLVVQSIGRVARKHPDKKLSIVYDIFDDCSYMTNPRSKFFGTLKENYSMIHYHVRNQYYREERFPVTEYSLEGIYEGNVDPDGLENRKAKAKKKAVKKTAKKKINVKPQFD